MAVFPEIYEDELIYSVLARFYVWNGYPAYAFCAEDIFIDKRARAEIEFINALRPEVLEWLCRDITIEELVIKHTMFPYYARFLPYGRRVRAFQALCGMEGDYNNLLAIPKQKNGGKKCLRYCPLCVEADRQAYGETFWHRSHQMANVSVCPIHGCRLLDSSVIISGKASPNLITAEQETGDMGIMYAGENDKQLAGYIGRVFKADMDMENTNAVGGFLHSEMAGTKYLSVRGGQRNIQMFYDDFMSFYRESAMQGLTELWQIQKVFNGYRFNCFEVCQMAVFLNIPIEKLCRMELPQTTQEQAFDDKVRELHRQGLKYTEIAKRLNASYNVVKPVGEGNYGRFNNRKRAAHRKCGAKPLDWEKIDKENLSLVKDAVRQLQGNGEERPHRVTEATVCKMLGFHNKRLDSMPLCQAEVLKHQEPQEMYWAREMLWAVRKIQGEGKTLNWKQIRVLTNMRKVNALAGMSYLKDIAEPDLYEVVLALL